MGPEYAYPQESYVHPSLYMYSLCNTMKTTIITITISENTNNNNKKKKKKKKNHNISANPHCRVGHLGGLTSPFSPSNTLILGGGVGHGRHRKGATLSHLADWKLLHKILDVAT